jgi:hypothetical protein
MHYNDWVRDDYEKMQHDLKEVFFSSFINKFESIFPQLLSKEEIREHFAEAFNIEKQALNI